MITTIKPHHYPKILEVWKARKLPDMPQSSLPDTGVCFEAPNGDLAAFGFIYKTNSDIAWAEWITTNPSFSAPARHEALDALIPSLLLLARINGARVVFTSVLDQGLISRYKKHGAMVGDSGATNMVWNVGKGD